MKLKTFLTFLFAGAALTLCAFKTSDITVNGKNYFKVESDTLILHFNSEGGRVDRIFSKKSKKEFVDASFRGAFHQYIWNPPSGFDFYYRRPFSKTVHPGKDTITVEYRGHHQGGGLDMLIVTKKYTLRKGSSILDVEFDFEHMFEAMGKSIYGFHFHNGLTLSGSKTIRYILPAEKGIIDYAGGAEEGNETVTPSRGWMAALSKENDGFALSLPFPELKHFMLWGKHPPRTTVEWRLNPQAIANGSHFKYRAQLIFFKDLPAISGAGNGVTGALLHKKDAAPGNSVPVEIKLFAALPGQYDAELFCRENGKGKWIPVFRKKINSRRSDAVLSVSGTVSRKNAGLTELEAVIRRDGKEVARLNSAVTFGKADREGKIDVLEPKKGTEIKRGDLTCFTHHTPDPDAVPWGKPLKGGPLKILALTPNINQVGDLADRFGCN
ncbi:MAG: hypothetical protein IKA87_03920, partial [Lentisphaeria bacterium]|nr:hypothetical protein [Lentisphaeria bacterium]